MQWCLTTNSVIKKKVGAVLGFGGREDFRASLFYCAFELPLSRNAPKKPKKSSKRSRGGEKKKREKRGLRGERRQKATFVLMGDARGRQPPKTIDEPPRTFAKSQTHPSTSRFF
jgi:hypothetical protein